ncbi:MAG TPA: hypothetical protein VLU46_07995 [Thermoanaerobaculia bacterium]|nr:hypothetical protein [Thermoanaerobaculia bacterium]
MRHVALLLAALVVVSPAGAASKRRSVGRHVPEPPYGVFVNVTALTDATDVSRAFNLAAADGVKSIRVPFVWSLIQSQSAQFADLRFYDQVVADAAGENLQITAVLGYATQWNTTAPASETRPQQREHYPPADYDAWSRFVSFLVNRYKDRVHTWEIWNQPDVGAPPDETQPCDGFWCGSPRAYADLLNVSYDAIKAADPNATVVFGSLAVPRDNPNFLYNVLTANEALPRFDNISFYAFGSKTDILGKFNSIKTGLVYGGAGLRTMWASFGYPSDPAAQTIAPYSGGEDGQAAYMTDTAAFLLSLGMKRLFWFHLVDSDASSFTADSSTSYGLLTSTFATKKAYTTYGTLVTSFKP